MAPESDRPTLADLLAPVAVRIRDARREHTMTWRALARRAGMRPATLRHVEAGERAVSASIVGRIARALGIDEEELYPGGRPDVFWERLATQMRVQRPAPLRRPTARRLLEAA